MGKIKVADFDIRYTVESAQPLTFFGDIHEEGKRVDYVSDFRKFEVRQHKNAIEYFAMPKISEHKARQEVVRRFGLKDNMQKIYEQIATDQFLVESIEKYPGMRITRNDPWETTVCFVMSQFNNVKRIRGIVKKLIEVYGDTRSFEHNGREIIVKSFPTPETFANLSVKEIMRCGTGFRGKYIRGIAQQCVDGFDLYKLQGKKYEHIKEELMTLPGIGDKVADCILLMGYEKLEAFPVDTWIKRIVERVYFKGKVQSIKTIHKFADERWGKDAGYAQQYLFWHGRSLKIN